MLMTGNECVIMTLNALGTPNKKVFINEDWCKILVLAQLCDQLLFIKLIIIVIFQKHKLYKLIYYSLYLLVLLKGPLLKAFLRLTAF